MPIFRTLAITFSFLFAGSRTVVLAQAFNVREFLVDLKIVEKEEAAAKEVRLKWISEERARIRGELTKFESELTELKEIVPDPIKARVVPPAVAKAQEREQRTFNSWASNNDPLLNTAIMKGSGINALLRVLGPIAHYRKMRSAGNGAGAFPSLAPASAILATDVSSFRMVPATSAGSNVVVRLNQLLLELQWPPVVVQNWPVECKSILKLRDEYVATLNSSAANDTPVLVSRAELLDSALELLQAVVIRKKRTLPANSSLTTHKRNQVHRDLQDALRYLETVRATAERFKKAPGDYKVHHFPGGSIEEFLDFCYTHGMIFQEARPADQAAYVKLFRRMQDYAHDVQFVEDWKDNLRQRIQELNADDRRLVWDTSTQ